MSTKKADSAGTKKRLERGRFAKMLASGYTIKVKPSRKQESVDGKAAKPSAASRQSKA